MTTNNNRLTSAEITNLLAQFEQETMSVCISKYVLATVEDAQIRSVFQYSLDISKNHVQKLKDLFIKEGFPVPVGLTDNDINLKAPPLFTDIFWLKYQYSLARSGLLAYGLAFSVSVRKDIRDYYYQCNIETMDLYNKIIDLLLSKGLYKSPPYFSTPKKVEYITNYGYTLNVMGKKRTLNVAEAGNIYFNLTMTRIAKGICLGFSQVTQDKEVRQFFDKVINSINKNYGIFSELLREDNLPVPELMDTEVTNSTVAPFSEKLMMLKVGFLLGTSLSYYGTALVASLRADVAGHCEAAVLRGLKLLPSWENIIIKNGWLERLPDADGRQELG